MHNKIKEQDKISKTKQLADELRAKFVDRNAHKNISNRYVIRCFKD